MIREQDRSAVAVKERDQHKAPKAGGGDHHEVASCRDAIRIAFQEM
ncbi:hypothetical protein ACFW3D_07750 [Streptomyces sp. NPDC058864]